MGIEASGIGIVTPKEHAPRECAYVYCGMKFVPHPKGRMQRYCCQRHQQLAAAMRQRDKRAGNRREVESGPLRVVPTLRGHAQGHGRRS